MIGGDGRDRGDGATAWLDDGVLPALPRWLAPIVAAVRRITPEDMSKFLPPPEGGRPGAVLMLFGEAEHGRDLLLIERAATMRSHAGQPAFPGGAIDADDADAIAAALREAEEETGLDPRGVTVFGALPDLWLPPSGFVVTPVLGWWSTPSPVSAADPAEVASVHRVRIEDLLDPRNRVEVRHPLGYVGPGFEVNDLLVWGFTAGLISRLFDAAGWTLEWEPARQVDISPYL
ncbi:MAG: CoA pyrophosphatase [Candidatus Nanopelagicales bacterium]